MVASKVVCPWRERAGCRSRGAQRPQRGRRRRLRIEWLEDRRLLSGGGLDPAFGNNGIVETTLPNGQTGVLRSVALQSDGKIVAAGSVTSNSTDEFAVVRYNTDGSIDTSFGNGGIVETSFGGNDDGYGVAIQSDGKIVVVGTSVISGVGAFAVERLNTDGTLDTSFGTGGQVRTVDTGGNNAAYAVALQSNGDIVVVGSSAATDGTYPQEFALARYNPAGTLDTSFGNNGFAKDDVTGQKQTSVADSALIDADGNIVVGGTGNSEFALARFTPIGALDTSFGTNGVTLTQFGTTKDTITSLAFDPSNEIVAAGQAIDSTKGSFIALALYTTSGNLDTGFGSSGLVQQQFTLNDTANAVAVQPDGKIVVAGQGAPGDFELARFTTTGLVDTGFGNNGFVLTHVGNQSAAYGMVLQPDAKIDVVGVADSTFAAARYYIGDPNGDFQFSASTYTVPMLNGSVTIEVDRENGSLGTATVNYATSDGTAQSGVEYTGVSGTLTFGPGVTQQTFTVPILVYDQIVGTTNFNVTLSSPTGGADLGTPSTAIVNILDQPGSLQFAQPVYTVSASAGQATITVTRAVGDGGAVSVAYATSDGSAKGNVDYTPVFGVLNFADGQLTNSFVVPLLSDPTATGTLTVNLTLSNPGGGATLGSPSTAVLDIEIAPGTIQFATTTFSTNVTSGQATIEVDRVNGTDGTVTVGYATSAGTAVPGVNYTNVYGTLTFGPGVSTQFFTVPLINNGLTNGNLTVNLSLNNPTGGAKLGGRDLGTLIIIDAPGTLQFSQPNYNVWESAGQATVTVTRTAGMGGLVQVNYATSDNTAISGIDYTPTTGVLTLAPGIIAASFTVPILDDGVIGGVNKTINLTLSSPTSGALLGSQSKATITILDDHPPAQTTDFLGNGTADLGVYRPPTSQWFVLGVGAPVFGGPGDIPVPGDYDGVGHAEFAVFRPSTDQWFILGPTGGRVVTFGGPGDIPVPANYDGDARDEIAVFRPSTGQWFIINSVTGQGKVFQFGGPGDIPVPGDYEGSGRDNIAVFNPATSVWSILGNTLPNQVFQLGLPGAVLPVPGQYDGQNITEPAVFNPSTAQWIIRGPTSNRSFYFGGPGDIPVPADYDADGVTDIAVYRPSTAQWFIIQSRTGMPEVVTLGATDLDLPLQMPIAYRDFAYSPSLSVDLVTAQAVAPSQPSSPSITVDALAPSRPAAATINTIAAPAAATPTPPSSTLTLHDTALQQLSMSRFRLSSRFRLGYGQRLQEFGFRSHRLW
jgi:uncharacterized delta-60 repeat protein